MKTKAKTAPKQKAQKSIVGSKIESLPVPLTEDELSDRGKRLAAVEGELESHRERAGEIRAELNATKTRLEAERSLLAMVIRNREERRPIRVEVQADWTAGLAFEMREDTGEIVRSRPLTDDDRQVSLLGEGH